MSQDPLATFRLDGKVALVTGGNGGLGQAIARGLRAVGAEVTVTGRDAVKNLEAVEDHGAHNVLEVDVRDEESVSEAIAAVVERHGRFDVLVNNAGVGGSYSVLDMTLEEWRLLVDTSLTGSFLCSKHAARAMIEAGNGGAIINLGSMYSVFGPPRAAGYASAKAGILGLSRALAVELAPHGIRSNAILPGWIETAMTEGAFGWEKFANNVMPRIPQRRWGQPADFGGIAVYLASSASAYHTGDTFMIDGGYGIF
jgi:2-deoxy-D-gluconate 3-dehydrogenase